MKNTILSLLLIILFGAYSCTTKKITTTTTTSHTSADTTKNKIDSIFIERIETINDTHFIVKPDSAAIRALIECDKKGRAYLKEIYDIQTGSRLSQNIKIEDNIIYVTAKIDSAKIYFQYKETHIKEVEISKFTENIKEVEKTSFEQTIKKTIYRLPWWVWLIAAAVAAFIVLKYVFPWLKLFF